MKTTFGDSYSIESVKKMLNLKELNFFKTERFYNLSDGTTTDVPVLMCRAENTEENELPTVKTKNGKTVVPLRLSYEVAMDAKAFKAKEENKNVLLSNNERMENWKKKGAGGAQLGMSLMMAKGSVKNAPKTHATARNTAKAIETKNNATLMAKGKVGLRDRISNARSGFSETVGWKALKKGVGDYHKNNSLKTKVADVAKAPLKLTKEAVMEPVRLVTGTVKGGARLVTKKGRAKIKGDIEAAGFKITEI